MLVLYSGIIFIIGYYIRSSPFPRMPSRVESDKSTGRKPLRYKAVRHRGDLCDQRGGRLGWLVGYDAARRPDAALDDLFGGTGLLGRGFGVVADSAALPTWGPSSRFGRFCR